MNKDELAVIDTTVKLLERSGKSSRLKDFLKAAALAAAIFTLLIAIAAFFINHSLQQDLDRRHKASVDARAVIVQNETAADHRLLQLIRANQAAIAKHEGAFLASEAAQSAHDDCTDRLTADTYQGEIAWFNEIDIAEHLPLTSPRRAILRRDAFDRRAIGLGELSKRKCPPGGAFIAPRR